MPPNPRPGPIGGPGLRVLFVGINPSLRSAEVGHHFARPGNRFWPTLEAAGFTPRRLTPEEDGLLPSFGLGVTNIVARPTRAAAELSVDELRAGAGELEATVRAWAPRLVAVVGVVAYRHAFGRPQANMGLQEEELGGRPVWILPNPSGLNAHYKPADFARLYALARRYAVSLGQAPSSSSTASARTRSRITSRMPRTSSRGRPAGSGRSQSM
jgi:double-stranded uracil-DNA glycosylase